MKDKYIQNERNNWVKEPYNNLQKEFCICWDCKHFNPNTEDKGCATIKQVLNLANERHIVLPVWECPNFSLK